MTKLAMEKLVLPAANLGLPNPLPSFRELADDREVKCEESVPPRDRARLGKACGTRVLPYPVLDGYDDRTVPRPFTAVILDNGRLRATVLPALGGRLWSLVDLRDGRELLARNPVVRYANVALCNAWVAGGIEWNCGRLGHHWLTSSPVFAGLVRGPGKEPGIRLWEFDRVNRVVWQVDLRLPDGSDFLFACIRMTNLNDEEVPAYWWTNMAVPETPDVRVLVPANRVLCHRAGEGLGLNPLPAPEGFDAGGCGRNRDRTLRSGSDEFDATRAIQHPHAWEGYFYLEDGRPFVAAVDSAGHGFVQTSTRLLRGRKMFAWGTDRSGRWWQRRLGDETFAYCEIQAGLARTQVETVPMPAAAAWSWTEAFGRLDADPAVTHGADWGAARRHAAERLEAKLPEAEVEARHAEFGRVLDAPPEAILFPGSGWGALDAIMAATERGVYASAETPTPASAGAGALEERRGTAMPTGTPFPPSTLGEEQEPWLKLLETGLLPARGPAEPPVASMVRPEWEPLLAAHAPRWDALLQLGILRMERCDTAGARAAWEASVVLVPSAWALRNLAQLAAKEKRPAADLLARAWELAPESIRYALARERLEALLAASLPAEAVRFSDSLPPAIRDRDRMKLLTARAALAAGDTARARALAATIAATDLREGESALDDLRAALSGEKR